MLGALRHRAAPPESRRQPVPATHRLTPGLPLRGRRPMTNPFQTVSDKAVRRPPHGGESTFITEELYNIITVIYQRQSIR